jgi:5-methylcytosine-specific restriction endonuclease McrA
MDKIDAIIAENQDVWKTRSAFFSWLKGLIRKGWSTHPVKIKHLKKNRIKIENPNEKSKKRFPFIAGQKCCICGELFPEKECQVDHILEETASLTSLDDVKSCVEKLLVVKDSDLRTLCKGCHSIVTLQQKIGVSFEEAAIEQRVINTLKNKAEALDLLRKSGYTGDAVSNESKRRKLLRELLSKD